MRSVLVTQAKGDADVAVGARGDTRVHDAARLLQTTHHDRERLGRLVAGHGARAVVVRLQLHVDGLNAAVGDV